MSKSKQVLVSVSILAMLLAGASFGAEWPSWRGPSQMGVSTETGLISDWSPDGENLIWREDFVGRSTPVVMNGRVFVNGRTGTGIDSQAVIAAYDAQTGAPVWEHRYTLYLTTVPYNRVGWASLTGDPETGNIYAQLVNGTFLCLNGDGETVWSRSLKEEFGRFEGYGGRTASAVIDEERVIVNMINGSWGPQGPPRHRYFAFDKRSGDVVWMSTPGGNVYDRNTQSVPVVSVVDGQRLLIGGSADGHVYALQARTGKKVWEFELSKRGITVSPVVADGRVFISHSEENVDEGALGRVVAIDATGSGDVTSTHELWRWNRQQAGFPSPAIHDGRVYVIDNSANLSSLDAETGEIHWEISIGTVGKASPVWADGKIYATETNGHLAIVQPGESEASILSRHQLEVPEGRYAELYGSAAIAYGRIYFTTEEGVYCLGDPSADFAATRSPEPSRGDEGAAEGDPAMLIVVPAEVTIAPGGRFDFEVLAFDAKGRPLGQVDAEVELKGLAGDLSSKRFAVGADSGFQAGTVIAKAAGLEAVARVRVFPPLPWSDDFSDGRKGWWIGAGRYEVRDDGTLVKPVAARGLLRSPLLLGPPSLEDYTIQVDMKPAQKGRRRTDGGVINSGYILDLLGIHQRLQIRSWTAVPRIDVTADYTVEMDRWYTLKLKVTQDGATALVQGKVWPRGEAEPSEWTVTSTDPHPVLRGSPGILGYSPAEVAYDNVQITGN
ncbi:MAG: PQQ-binding-like beta-propeller repeat protein [Acidobacteriota bacterium]|nr:PQQ-binding-like beta-propeller repeat protein [Acidobacteriota bacterium]